MIKALINPIDSSPMKKCAMLSTMYDIRMENDVSFKYHKVTLNISILSITDFPWIHSGLLSIVLWWGICDYISRGSKMTIFLRTAQLAVTIAVIDNRFESSTHRQMNGNPDTLPWCSIIVIYEAPLLCFLQHNHNIMIILQALSAESWGRTAWRAIALFFGRLGALVIRGYPKQFGDHQAENEYKFHIQQKNIHEIFCLFEFFLAPFKVLSSPFLSSF